MQEIVLIDKYYSNNTRARSVLLGHSQQVAMLAVAIAKDLQKDELVDLDFVRQAALLHDLGMIYTEVPEFSCHGGQPYIAHGVLGAELLMREGLPRHALVCERHIGVGLSVADIKKENLLLPLRDMRPQSLEEKIITYADLFFSKSRQGMRTPELVRTSLAKYGQHKVDTFDNWHVQFGATVRRVRSKHFAKNE